jgi:hypothetical protein
MFRQQVPAGHPDIFTSAKTLCAIPARHAALRDALVLSSLDPEVRSIGFAPSAHVASQQVEISAVFVTKDGDDHLYFLDVIPARSVRTSAERKLARAALDSLGLKPLVVTAEDLRRQPRYANCLEVWSCNGLRVPVGLRVRAMQVLLDDGPMSLARLLSSLTSDRDPTRYVLAMACADLIEIDLLTEKLGPSTMLRSRQ